MTPHISTALLLAGALGLAGCKTTKDTNLPPDPIPTDGTSVADPNAGTGGGGAAAVGTQAHFEQAVGGRNTIYFDTDRFDVDAEDQAALQAQATYLRQYPQLTITVEGHADERGTREYNLALGERRATAARNYLVGLGVADNRITTISYGKERPVALGSDEAAWTQNRRAVSIVVN